MASTTSASPRFKLPLVKDQRVQDILLWVDPKRSGIALGGATAVFLALQYGSFNAVSVGAYGLLIAVLGAFVWNNLANKFQNSMSPLPVPAVLRTGVAEADVKKVAERATVHLNQGLALANRLAAGREPVLTAMAAGGLYFAAVWGPLLTSNLLLLAYLLVLAAFTLPKGYELKKDEVDGLVDTARVHVTAVHDKFLAPVLAKIPRASTARPAESSSTKKET